ncbi:unnamed protein product [Symbiodinium sp. CCMP2456]|nr:unnamed protein product [Symbiodinium sp. CCMP2456]
MSSHGWVCSLSIPLRASSVLVLSNFHFATGAVSDLWPNPLYGFTNNNRLGSTPKRDAVDSDFRHYYQLAALELLLVHHGFRPCETTLSSQQDMRQLEKTISAVEAFQSNRSLPSNPLGLNGPFWEELVVPVKPGDESAAVLALHWLVQSTSQVSRPPLWDTMEVERHRCQAQLDASMQAKIQGGLASDAELMDELNASWSEGLPSSVWRHLLQRAEQRVASGCLGRAFVARAFGVAWVFVWCLSAGFFAFFHIDGWNHGSSEKACMEPKTFRKVLRFGHEVALLGVVMLSHSLSVLGLWSFPSDLVSQVFVGFQITAAAVVAVRLAAKRGRRLPPEKNCMKYSANVLLMVLAFLFYCLVSLVPELNGLWYAVFLVGLLAAWSIAVLVIADWNRVMKCGLFFAMWILAFAAPTLLSLLVGLLGTFGFWLSVFTPVLLLLLSLAAERLIGPLIEAKCEYTAETNWMLALLFRMCIEQVRFNTALAVLLLSLLAQRGFGPFLLHLVQSFLFAVVLRRPKCACTPRDAFASAPHGAFCRYLFHASQIVSHTGSGAIWQYRSEAVVLPLEIVLFLTHMFQLLLVGMPVGVSASSWWLGLVLLVLLSMAREVLSGVLSIWRRMLFPHIPWSALPGHLIAIVVGVAMATSTFSQVHFFWFFYAHHWAVCYIGGPSSTGMEVAEDKDAVGSIITGVIGVVLLFAHVYSFCLWSLWLGRLEWARQPSKERSRNKQELVQAFRRSASLTLDDRQQKKAMLVRSPKTRLHDEASRRLEHSAPAMALPLTLPGFTDPAAGARRTLAAQVEQLKQWDGSRSWSGGRQEESRGEVVETVRSILDWASSIDGSDLAPAFHAVRDKLDIRDVVVVVRDFIGSLLYVAVAAEHQHSQSKQGGTATAKRQLSELLCELCGFREQSTHSGATHSRGGLAEPCKCCTCCHIAIQEALSLLRFVHYFMTTSCADESSERHLPRHMEDGVLELLHLVTTLSSALHEDCFLVAQRSDHLQWWPRYEQLRRDCPVASWPLTAWASFQQLWLDAEQAAFKLQKRVALFRLQTAQGRQGQGQRARHARPSAGFVSFPPRLPKVELTG